MKYKDALKLVGDSFGNNDVAKHSKAVCKKATEIAETIRKNGHEVDVELVRMGALLHDIGRVRTHDETHGVESGRILRELGFDEIAQAAERHTCIVFKDIVLEDMSLEEKIILYADRLMDEDREVTLEERFDRIVERRKRYNKENDIPMIMSTFEKTKEIERELKELMGPTTQP